jgi:hypothetical protein
MEEFEFGVVWMVAGLVWIILNLDLGVWGLFWEIEKGWVEI